VTDKIAIIGFGNIASAIVTPLFDNKLIQPEHVFCVVNSEKSLENLKINFKHNINVYKSGSKESKIIWDCQYKLLSIKPQQLNDISEAHHIKNKDNLIVSILAGGSINRLTQKFPDHKCVRVVTNIPITIGKGLTGISWGKEITEDQKQFTKKLFENTSKIYELTIAYASNNPQKEHKEDILIRSLLLKTLIDDLNNPNLIYKYNPFLDSITDTITFSSNVIDFIFRGN